MTDPIGSMKKFVHLSIEIANGQIATLHYIGPGTIRKTLIHDLRNKVLYLEQLVEETERSIIEEIETMSNNIVSMAAKSAEMYIVSEGNKDKVDLTRLTEKELVKRLDQMEKETAGAISCYFKDLRDQITKTLETIDKLPC